MATTTPQQQSQPVDTDEFFWFWYGDDGDWKPFDAAITTRLEQARRQGQPTVPLTLGNNNNSLYVLDLHQREQINLATGYSRPVTCATACWYYWCDSNDSGTRSRDEWKRYSRDNALQLALADVSPFETTAYLQQGDAVLYVDLERLVQTNVETHQERPIRRGPSFVVVAEAVQQQQQPPQSTPSEAAVSLAAAAAEEEEATVDVEEVNHIVHDLTTRSFAASTNVVDNNNTSEETTAFAATRFTSATIRNHNNTTTAITPSHYNDDTNNNNDEIILSDSSTDDEDDILQEFLDQERPAFACPLVCPLSKKVFRDPVQTLVGSTYERKYIERYLQTHDHDPQTGILLTHKVLRDNRGVRDTIEEWKESLLVDRRQLQLRQQQQQQQQQQHRSSASHDNGTAPFAAMSLHAPSTTPTTTTTNPNSRIGCTITIPTTTPLSRSSTACSAITEVAFPQHYQQEQYFSATTMAPRDSSNSHHHHQEGLAVTQNHSQLSWMNDILQDTTITTTTTTTTTTRLKVVCLGLANTGSEVAFRNPVDAQGRLGVHRSKWNLRLREHNYNNNNHINPSSIQSGGLQCNVYTFYGQNVHHATQKLFFSPRSIYVIVWDMAATNPRTFVNLSSSSSSNNNSNNNNGISCSSTEQEARAALERDVCEKVQFWVDAIQQQAPHSIIIPVVSLDGSFGDTTAPTNSSRSKPKTYHLDPDEVHKRCLFLKRYFDEDWNRERDGISARTTSCDNCNHQGGNKDASATTTATTKPAANWSKLIFGSDDDPVLRAGGSSHANGIDGLESLKRLILQLSEDASLFPNVRQLQQSMAAIGPKTQNAVIKLLVEGARIVEFNQFCDEIDDGFVDQEQVRAALQVMSDTGDILYYGTKGDTGPLGQFVILDPSWIVSAVACILRGDIHSVIKNMKRRHAENMAVATTEETKAYHGPVASDSDIRSLWRTLLTSDGTVKVNMMSSEGDQLLDFLQLLFIRTGLMVSLYDDDNDNNRSSGVASSNFISVENMASAFPDDGDSVTFNYCHPNSKLMFFPGLLRPGEHGKFVGIYNNAIFSKTMLAQSVLFHRMVSPVLLERICASVLKQVYARTKHQSTGGDDNRTATAEDKEGTIYVKDILCWRTLLCFKLGLYARTSHGDVQPSFVDVYAHLVESSSELCVGASFMGRAKQCLIVSAKGEGGNEGEVIWKGGYDFITEAIRSVMEKSPGLDFERYFFCPSCLAKENLRDTRGWSECVLQRALEEGEEDLICEEGHSEKTQLLLGPSAPCDATEKLFPSAVPHDVHADVLMPGVVMVGLYDERHSSDRIRKVGSGFIVDAEQGLIVTAAHTLMKLWGMEDYGRDFDGIEGAKAVIGIIPEKKKESDEVYPPAVFRYFATIYKKDASLEHGECHVDACILQITSRFENDVDGNGDFCGEEISVSLTGKPVLMKEQRLTQLKITEESHLGEPIRILGYDQPDNTKVNRSFGISAGFVYKQFETQAVGGERYRYMPRKKTVLICPTIGGHSGGPAVNQKGEVIGILSCADFTEKSRAYIVPTSEWIHLLPKKKERTPSAAGGADKQATLLAKGTGGGYP